jgi:hypothetical protein
MIKDKGQFEVGSLKSQVRSGFFPSETSSLTLSSNTWRLFGYYKSLYFGARAWGQELGDCEEMPG